MQQRRSSAALAVAALAALTACSDGATSPPAAPAARSSATVSGSLGINVLLTGPLTDDRRAQLGALGTLLDEIPELNALTMRISADQLDVVRGLPFVAAAGPDAARTGVPIDGVAVTDFADGRSTWDLDAINVTSAPGTGTRAVAETGAGVYVGILDTGLLDSWREYFPEQRIATQYARSFGGGGGDNGNVAEQPNKWEHDQNSHGTHVTSTILGYQLGTATVTGVAPQATVIPVKVLNQNGSGWSSAIARGIVYIADLKAGALAGHPVVINMSLGGSQLDPLEKAAIDYAIAQGVVIVAAAGNEGTAGMGYPGAYAPVISAAAAGWKKEGSVGNWWYALDVPDPTDASQFYIADFSSRSLGAQQDLDVAAPGVRVVGPYQTNSGTGQLSYFYLSGTSMASPHVAGIVALMQQRNPSLTAAQAESILTSTAVAIPGVPATVQGAGLAQADAALAAASGTLAQLRK